MHRACPAWKGTNWLAVVVAVRQTAALCVVTVFIEVQIWFITNWKHSWLVGSCLSNENTSDFCLASANFSKKRHKCDCNKLDVFWIMCVACRSDWRSGLWRMQCTFFVLLKLFGKKVNSSRCDFLFLELDYDSKMIGYDLTRRIHCPGDGVETGRRSLSAFFFCSQRIQWSDWELYLSVE